MDVQVLTSIQCDGRMDLDAFVVGNGVFHRVSDLGDYEQWQELYIDDNGNLILPYCEYDSSSPEEKISTCLRTELTEIFGITMSLKI